MTLFAREAAADAPQWMVQDYPRHPGWLADLLVAPRKDPVLRQAWIEAAQARRDEHIREWLLEDRPIGNELMLHRWRMQTTPKAAMWWFDTTTVPAGHRLVLTEVTR